MRVGAVGHLVGRGVAQGAEPVVGGDDLSWVSCSSKDLRDQPVGIKGDWRDQLLKLRCDKRLRGLLRRLLSVLRVGVLWIVGAGVSVGLLWLIVRGLRCQLGLRRILLLRLALRVGYVVGVGLDVLGILRPRLLSLQGLLREKREHRQGDKAAVGLAEGLVWLGTISRKTNRQLNAQWAQAGLGFHIPSQRPLGVAPKPDLLVAQAAGGLRATTGRRLISLDTGLRG